MASQFLASHGVDLQKEMSKAQFGDPQETSKPTPLSRIVGVRLPRKDGLWDISIADGLIKSTSPHEPEKRTPTDSSVLLATEQFLAPSLCHPHIHLDKCFLLSDPKYADLEIIKGDFAEAMELTGKAKARFEEDDLLRRGRQLISESVAAGVTAMRAFVEVDEVVEFRCLEAGLVLKKEFEKKCEVQLCVFAQLPVFTGEDGGAGRRSLIETAVRKKDVDVIGSTPYVEKDLGEMLQNLDWVIELALKEMKHLDLHLDYNLDEAAQPLVWRLLNLLDQKEWERKAKAGATITLGHCTRLTLFSREEWQRLKRKIGSLPASFVGLPTSDLFMMGRPNDDDDCGPRVRGTLQIPQMIKQHELNSAVGVNNIGNAFTPQGNCDPMTIASLGVGLYHAGTKEDAEVLYVRPFSSTLLYVIRTPTVIWAVLRRKLTSGAGVCFSAS